MNVVGMKRLYYVVCMIIPFLSSCCEERDGDWESMKWKVENYSPERIRYDKRTKQIYVDYKGGSIDLICKNYNGFWFTMYTGEAEDPEDVYHHMTGEWYDLRIEGNALHCNFFENASGKPMEILKIPLSAGDIFCTFQVNRTFGELQPFTAEN